MYKIKKLIVAFLQFKRAFVNYSYRKFNIFEIFLLWINEHLTRPQFLILSGMLVGLAAGLAGVILKVIVHYIQHFISTEVPFEERLFVYAIFPLVGITLTILVVTYFFKGDEDKELAFVLKNISQNQSKIKSTKMYSQIVQSGITVGFGLIHESLFRYLGESKYIILVFLALTTLVKACATSIMLGSGGNGGIFAPSLVADGFLGYVFRLSL